MWQPRDLRKVKQALRDQYHFQPSPFSSGTNIFFDKGTIPNGEYPVVINQRLAYVYVRHSQILYCKFNEETAVPLSQHAQT